MPRLLLLRHAKAERARAGEQDHERALSERGREDCTEIGRIIAERGEHPDLVLCSSSLRTRQTWDLVRPALDDGPAPRFLRDIYEAEDDYLPILRREGGGAASLLLIGHNPAMHATAVRLIGVGGGRDGAQLKDGFPTAALAILDFDGDWRSLKADLARLAAFVRPEGSRRD